jgi:hypothetical protein
MMKIKTLTMAGLAAIGSLIPCKAYCQTTTFTYSCGKSSAEITWTQSARNGQTIFTSVQGAETNEYAIGGDWTTLSWHYVNSDENTDLTVTKANGSYRMEGMFKAKPVSETIRSEGQVWRQNIGFHLADVIEGKSSITFECFRPDNLQLYEMKADAKEINHNEQRVNVHLTGLLSRFYGVNYLIDTQARGHFVRYKGIHGPPGTPETTITIRR